MSTWSSTTPASATSTSRSTASLDDARAEIEANYLGIVSMTKSFAPVLAENGGGAFVNMLSVLSWFAAPVLSTYSASKAAAWLYSNAARVELKRQGTEVVGVHVGYVDTDLIAEFDAEKLAPAGRRGRRLRGARGRRGRGRGR